MLRSSWKRDLVVPSIGVRSPILDRNCGPQVVRSMYTKCDVTRVIALDSAVSPRIFLWSLAHVHATLGLCAMFIAGKFPFVYVEYEQVVKIAIIHKASDTVKVQT